MIKDDQEINTSYAVYVNPTSSKWSVVDIHAIKATQMKHLLVRFILQFSTTSRFSMYYKYLR